MKTLSSIFVIILLLSCSSGDGMHKKVEYKIDPGIKGEVDQNTRKEGNMDIGSLEIRYYENDSLITESFSNDKSIPFWIMQKHSSTGIQLTGVVGMFDASGFQLQITKEKFDVSYFSNSDFGIYKKQKYDSILAPGITLKCTDASLTLHDSPKFEDKEQVIGIVEFKTPEFWEVSNGKEKKIRLEGKAYFSAVLENQKHP